MKSPIELLQARLDEMITEYDRVSKIPQGNMVNSLEFMAGMSKDLTEIRPSIEEYREAINDLIELKNK